MRRVNIKNLLKDQELLKQFFCDLENGALAIIPTDTIYGLAVDAKSDEAVAKIYEIKKRCGKKPLILFLHSAGELQKLKIKPDVLQKKLIKQGWPGALTAIFPDFDQKQISAHKYPTLGIRVPAHNKLLELLKLYGGGVLTTSANRSGDETLNDPQALFAEFCHEVDWLIEDGIIENSLPSTVVDMSTGSCKILRQGAFVPKL
jgi:L-threonylcarbamoyladenylate synthase